MASSSKSRLFHELSRSRTTSPNEYETAGSFDMYNDQILHSTVNMDNITAQPPLIDDEHHSYLGSDAGSEGSTDMSIELGRGVKRGARENDADVSSNVVFNFGGDSQYEITGTPPVRPRNTSRKSDDLLRRQASVRHATEAAKSNRKPSTTQQRYLSEVLQRNAESDASLNAEDFAQPTVTFNARNTRFTRSRQTSAAEPTMPPRITSASAQKDTPRRQAVNNPTVQSATFTSNSFALPDLPNITELVSGVRKDGTPVFNRTTNKSRSRFTSAGNYRAPSQTQHVPIESVPIPDEEKAIFASLQVLKERVDSLEMEKAEAEKRGEEYEDEIIDLRSQLQAERRRPDSALGSDEDERAAGKWRVERTRLQASLKAAEDRLDRAERKISVGEIAVKRVTKARDALVKQIAMAYWDSEELKEESESLKEHFGTRYSELQGEHEDLQEEMEVLRKENQVLRVQVAQSSVQQSEETQHRGRQEHERTCKLGKRKESVPATRDIAREDQEARDHSPQRPVTSIRGKKEAGPAHSQERTTKRTSSAPTKEPPVDLASKIAREVQKLRSEAKAAKVAEQEPARQGQSANRARSKSQLRQASAGVERRTSQSMRAVSAPIDTDLSEPESTTGRELTQEARKTLKEMVIPGPCGTAEPHEETRDITILSDFPSLQMAQLRKKIEEEHLAQKAAKKRNASAPEPRQQEDTVRSTHMGLPRKSSLKDVTAGLENATGRFSLAGATVDDAATKAARTVRVQSPHTSDPSLLPHQPQDDIGDTSMLSNISRRRRRAASEAEEGMTSAFILPDITLYSSTHPIPTTSTAAGIGKSCVSHDAATCTLCQPASATRPIPIPIPVPVTDRDTPQDPDITSATIRPAQSPPVALATVIKTLTDEITHLKVLLAGLQRRYQHHDPALSKRQRVATRAKIERLVAEVERRSDQVYALYDVLEGQKEVAAQAAVFGAAEASTKGMDEHVMGDTLMSLGLDPADLAGRVGRSAPEPLGGLDGVSEGSEEFGWEGLSDYESEEDVDMGFGRGEREREKRRSAAF
ncbi:hypothetical protein LTR54_012186 [Friedmanniomyces endolithicus]|uniref:Cep57 centrosome microtubule-binding domain-containing protein n=1 Tax=Friedmanniomyces endolithicus TaxID=329885 RepID=A0AAN6G277_9PEZI|nr:hypothetical protein LTS00_011501 [Friedmanniomyces endolithicus]KAK0327410.1 hypothetical protein LTR82_000925 [Friedmanniomyces endolithicus]KAK0990433.1 hypothetical protein LTR54_012186 [Friedmanniomyces endolithicus]